MNMKYIKRMFPIFLLVIIAIIVFGFIYGLSIVNFSSVKWLRLPSDSAQHYLGWSFYRESDFFWKIGLFNNLSYPKKVSIIYTDCLPLFAIILKPISFLLPRDFQYMGFYSILCFIFQIIFSYFILIKISKNKFFSFFASFFFVLSPFFFYRFFDHFTLGSHYIIFILMLSLIDEDKFIKSKNLVLFWGIIGFIIPMIHSYFLLIAGMFLIGFVFLDYSKKRDIKRVIVSILSYSIFGIFSLYILGAFDNIDVSVDEPSISSTFNLINFFNPNGYSRIFNDLFNKDGFDLVDFWQCHEGFAYFGMGSLLMILFGILIFIYRLLSKKIVFSNRKKCYIVAFFVIAVLSLAFSMYNTVCFGKSILFRIWYPKIIRNIFGIFASCGRFIWPFLYLVLFFGLFEISKIKGLKKFIIIFICLIVQVYDVSIKFNIDNFKNGFDNFGYDSDLTSNIWNDLNKDKKYKYMMYTTLEYDYQEFYSLVYYAYDNNLILNFFTYARYFEPEISLDDIDDKTIYVFLSKNKENCIDKGLYCYKADYYIIGLKNRLKDYEFLQ